jgi:hypothetical protein
VILIVIGVILFVLGAIAAAGGGALMALFGSDSTLTSHDNRVTTHTSALVVAMNDIKDTNGFASSAGDPTLRVTVRGVEQPVFVGIGPAAAVDQYLAGVPFDKVTDFDVEPFRLQTARQNGNGTAQLAPPQAQTFWTVRSGGVTASVSWKITDGSYRLVLINADASPSVTGDGTFSLRVPHLFPIGLTLLIAGSVVALIGIALVVLGARTPTETRAPTVNA